MIDLCSALYLDMRHGRNEIPGWRQMTTGLPASLSEDSRSRQIGERVARLQGLQQGMTAASTLHLFAALYEWLSQIRAPVYVDEYIYPVARFGMEKLASHGISVQSYRHLEVMHLGQLLKRDASKGLRPVVLSDGWCPQCGKAVPLESIATLLERYDGRLFMDDTQAFGLLGSRSSTLPGGSRTTLSQRIFGRGGGGLLRWSGVPADRIVSITSLAKSFGVPMAVISGRPEFIEEFRSRTSVNDHCSPPSIAHLSAADHALELNRADGDIRREKLFANVRMFRNKLSAAGIRTMGGLFPVQHLDSLSGEITLQLHRELKKAAIRTVLTSGHRPTGPLLTLLFRAGHSPDEVGYLSEMIIRFYKKKCISYGIYS